MPVKCLEDISRLTKFKALNYLGIQPTDEQQQALRQQLQKDSKGTVSFGDFVEVSRNLFSAELNATEDGQKSVTFGVNEIANLLDSKPITEGYRIVLGISRAQLFLLEAKAAVEETRALRSRIHLAEAAQRQARGMEMDYEEVIHLLEAEIVELKAQLTDHSGQNKHHGVIPNVVNFSRTMVQNPFSLTQEQE
ncbi:syntaxin-binding protein hypothetical protein [Limosa lapponica baueri]|uniref:EF-hand domain-containing protein n=1 Tax=Limosa lapponica baueri TaxID=1758121 RepID=A0A2I0TIY7_LIMLA|nr:syntaxin-binding protein hypothetical protein [Limosa lapponica baueri]